MKRSNIIWQKFLSLTFRLRIVFNAISRCYLVEMGTMCELNICNVISASYSYSISIARFSAIRSPVTYYFFNRVSFAPIRRFMCILKFITAKALDYSGSYSELAISAISLACYTVNYANSLSYISASVLAFFLVFGSMIFANKSKTTNFCSY
jgi:hypothetical protein